MDDRAKVLEFLKSKGLIKEGFKEFIIRGDFGQISLNDLILEYIFLSAPGYIRDFTGDMVGKLKANEHKEGWHNMSYEGLFGLLLQEVSELQIELTATKFDPDATMLECADCANFAMMISDKARFEKELENAAKKR